MTTSVFVDITFAAICIFASIGAMWVVVGFVNRIDKLPDTPIFRR